MIEYKTEKACTLPRGIVIGLTNSQAKRRKHLLEDKGNGTYLTLDTISFKQGEVVKLEASDMNKASWQAFKPVKGEHVAVKKADTKERKKRTRKSRKLKEVEPEIEIVEPEINERTMPGVV